MTAAPPITITRGGRTVVLKQLDDDCLLDGQLHPSIKVRLERVRELPVRCVANFLGVERDPPSCGVAQMVWEFVPGTPLAAVRSADWLKLSREVVLAVQSLHASGIVHGAIHGGNVILDDAGEIRLTHVSPLLYTDSDIDATDVVAMLEALVHEHAPTTPLAAMLADASTQQVTLSELYSRLAEVNVEPPVEEIPERERNPRTRYLVAAALIALIGVAMCLAIYWRLTADESQPYAPPVARSAEP
jgi:hypothetical protein